MHDSSFHPERPSSLGHDRGHVPRSVEPGDVSEKNVLVRGLPAESYARLRPQLEPVALAVKFVIWEPHAPIEWAYCPRTAVLSILVPLQEEKAVEAATVGCEGFVGVPVVLGAESSSTECIAQVPGEALRIRASILRDAAEEDRALRWVLLRYAQALHEQTAQSVACNARHEISERCGADRAAGSFACAGSARGTRQLAPVAARAGPRPGMARNAIAPPGEVSPAARSASGVRRRAQDSNL